MRRSTALFASGLRGEQAPTWKREVCAQPSYTGCILSRVPAPASTGVSSASIPSVAGAPPRRDGSDGIPHDRKRPAIGRKQVAELRPEPDRHLAEIGRAHV